MYFNNKFNLNKSQTVSLFAVKAQSNSNNSNNIKMIFSNKKIKLKFY